MVTPAALSPLTAGSPADRTPVGAVTAWTAAAALGWRARLGFVEGAGSSALF